MEEKRIVINADGKIGISGKWKVGELLRAAQLLAEVVNSLEFEIRAQEPAPSTPSKID